MKQVLSFFILSLSVFSSFAQIIKEDHDKYWNYRNRLRTYFLHVGPGQGESIPAGIRNFINWNDGNKSILAWGDATLYLGWYLGVLATEFHLLQQNGEDTKEIIKELCFAILAVERLDSVAETRWNFSPSVNGFLIRDDVPSDFLDRHPHLNFNLKDETNYKKNSGAPVLVTEIQSDFISNPHNAFSQDQLVHLLMGLSLSAIFSPSEVFSPDDVVHGKTVNYKINPKEKSKLLINKLVDYASNKYGSEPWQLRYPGNRVIPNNRGGDLRANATGIAQIGKIINGNKKDFLVALPFNIIWQLQQSIKALRKNISSLHMALVTAAASDYWRGFTSENTTEKGINFQGSYPAGRYLWIKYDANNYGWDIFYNYLRIAIHGYKKNNYPAAVEIINSAPFNGPYYHLEDKTAPGGWAASRRFIDNPGRQMNGSIHFPGNYNGLDFMLFFNLYHISDINANLSQYKKPEGFKFDH